MPRRKIFRVLGWTALTVFALSGFAATLVWHWTQTDRSHPSSEQILARKLRWPVPRSRDDHAAFLNRVGHEPRAVLGLLTDESYSIQRAARQVLANPYSQPDPVRLDDAIIEEITAELARPGWGLGQRRNLSVEVLGEILHGQGQRGIAALVSLYRRCDPLPLDLQQELNNWIRYPRWENTWTQELLNVALDPAVSVGNRVLAVQTLGHIAIPTASPHDEQANLTLRGIVIVISDTLPRMDAPVASAARETIVRLEAPPHSWVEETLDRDESEFPPAEDQGAKAILALADKADWKRVGHAADALARHGITAAIPALRDVAENHWYVPVRETARHALAVLESRESFLTPDSPNLPPFARFTSRFAQAPVSFAAPPQPVFPERSWWLKTFDECQRTLRPARDAVFWRLQPRFRQVLMEERGRLPRQFSLDEALGPMHPKQAVRFAGGKLLGYDDGEFGSGTAFYRRGEMPRFFPTPNVNEFIRVPHGVVVVCDLAFDGALYLAREQSDGHVSVTFYTRPPPYSAILEVRPNGELLLSCRGMRLIVSTTGEIRAAPTQSSLPGR